MSVAEQLAKVKERMAAAAVRSGRAPEAVKLVAVTKGAKMSRILEAKAAGIDTLAENRVQEALVKIAEVPAEWHMIGHLQSNKVKDAVDHFSLIQSVDTVRLAGKISDAAALTAKVYPILLEVNVSGESQKYGFSPEALYGAIDRIKELPNVKVTGLMGMAPASDTESRRAAFKKLKSLFSVCKGIKHERIEMKHLSMGMSDDFETAIEEGATMVRIGRAIFGDAP